MATDLGKISRLRKAYTDGVPVSPPVALYVPDRAAYAITGSHRLQAMKEAFGDHHDTGAKVVLVPAMSGRLGLAYELLTLGRRGVSFGVLAATVADARPDLREALEDQCLGEPMGLHLLRDIVTAQTR